MDLALRNYRALRRQEHSPPSHPSDIFHNKYTFRSWNGSYHFPSDIRSSRSRRRDPSKDNNSRNHTHPSSSDIGLVTLVIGLRLEHRPLCATLHPATSREGTGDR